MFGSLYNLPGENHLIGRILLVRNGIFDTELICDCFHTGHILGYENNNCGCGRKIGMVDIGDLFFNVGRLNFTLE